MTLKYKGKTYELVELYEPNKNETYDIIAIFKTTYDDDGVFWFKDFVNYFYGASEEDEESIQKIAKDYIDEYLEKQAKIDHEKELKNAYCDAFKKASKKDFGSREMEELETKQYDLLDYVLEIGLKENEDEER